MCHWGPWRCHDGSFGVLTGWRCLGVSLGQKLTELHEFEFGEFMSKTKRTNGAHATKVTDDDPRGARWQKHWGRGVGIK